jgi:stearoyl-CoA desaturase (delta-9 desaturase)
MQAHEVARMSDVDARTNPVAGRVVWSPIKSLWFSAHALTAVVGGFLTYRFEAACVACAFTVSTLCLGHSVGLHRLLVHRSFACPRWLEYFLVHLGTVVGMGGPFRILYMHDIRDWSQRHPACHSFFIHQTTIWRDFWRQMHCEVQLAHPPRFQIEPRVANDPVYRFMQRTWMLQALPWVILLYALGGVSFVVWGTAVRTTISLVGHWLIGYFAHNYGERDWDLPGHAVQGYNVPHLGLLTMGESWHNNHHAFPSSARLGLHPGQFDPGWWALSALRAVGLVWDVRVPENLPPRPELIPLTPRRPPRVHAASVSR